MYLQQMAPKSKSSLGLVHETIYEGKRYVQRTEFLRCNPKQLGGDTWNVLYPYVKSTYLKSLSTELC